MTFQPKLPSRSLSNRHPFVAYPSSNCVFISCTHDIVYCIRSGPSGFWSRPKVELRYSKRDEISYSQLQSVTWPRGAVLATTVPKAPCKDRLVQTHHEISFEEPRDPLSASISEQVSVLVTLQFSWAPWKRWQILLNRTWSHLAFPCITTDLRRNCSPGRCYHSILDHRRLEALKLSFLANLPLESRLCPPASLQVLPSGLTKALIPAVSRLIPCLVEFGTSRGTPEPGREVSTPHYHILSQHVHSIVHVSATQLRGDIPGEVLPSRIAFWKNIIFSLEKEYMRHNPSMSSGYSSAQLHFHLSELPALHQVSTPVEVHILSLVWRFFGNRNVDDGIPAPVSSRSPTGFPCNIPCTCASCRNCALTLWSGQSLAMCLSLPQTKHALIVPLGLILNSYWADPFLLCDDSEPFLTHKLVPFLDSAGLKAAPHFDLERPCWQKQLLFGRSSCHL